MQYFRPSLWTLVTRDTLKICYRQIQMYNISDFVSGCSWRVTHWKSVTGQNSDIQYFRLSLWMLVTRDTLKTCHRQNSDIQYFRLSLWTLVTRDTLKICFWQNSDMQYFRLSLWMLVTCDTSGQNSGLVSDFSLESVFEILDKSRSQRLASFSETSLWQWHCHKQYHHFQAPKTCHSWKEAARGPR